METRCQSRRYWANLWRGEAEASPVRRTQISSPERWRAFYDEVAADWDRMAGATGCLGRRVAGLLVGREGLVRPGRAVLEVGCGTGWLAVALARRGLRVTALDDSPGMLAVLADRVRRGGAPRLRPVHASWTDYRPSRPFDLAAAAFFPPAWEPEGLEHMEALSMGHCLLLLPEGEDPFPIRRRLWQPLLGEPLPRRRVLLPYLINYLLSGGRAPNLLHLRWRAGLRIPLARAQRFYERYFALLGQEGPGIGRRIAEVLAEHAQGGVVRCRGEAQAALLWWAVPAAGSCASRS